IVGGRPRRTCGGRTGSCCRRWGYGRRGGQDSATSLHVSASGRNQRGAILERHPVAKPLHLPALSRQLGRGESKGYREGIWPRHSKDSRRLCQPALPRSRQRSERLSALIACDEKVERRGGILEDVGIGELRDDIGRTLKPWIVGAERKALWCG